MLLTIPVVLNNLARKFEAREAERKEEVEKRKNEEKKRQDEEKSKAEELSILGSRVEDLQDLLTAKQRQLDRLGSENESLLEQMETYSQDAKASRQKLAQEEKVVKDLRVKVEGLEKKAGKAMELEAAVICAKESDKKLKEAVKTLEDKLKAGEENANKLKEGLALEKKLSSDKNSQIKVLSEKVESVEANQPTANVNNAAELEQQVTQLQLEKDKNEELLTETKERLVETKSGKEALEQERDALMQAVELAEKDKHQLMLQEEEARAEKSLLDATNASLLQELQELNTEIRRRGEKISELEKSQDETKGQADKLQVTLDKLHETEEQLQTTIAKNKTLSDDKAEAWRKLGETESKLKEVTAMVDTQKKEISSLDHELSSCRDQMEVDKERLNEIKSSSDKLQLMLNEKEEALTLLQDASRGKVQELEQVVADLQEGRQQVQETELKALFEEATRQGCQAQEQAEKLNNELQETRAELETKNAEVAELKTSAAEQNTVHSTATEDLQNQLLQSQEAVTKTNTALNVMKEETQLASTKIQDLEKELRDKSDQLKIMNDNMLRVEAEKSDLEANVVCLSSSLEAAKLQAATRDESIAPVDHLTAVESETDQLDEQKTNPLETILELESNLQDLKQAESKLKNEVSQSHMEIEKLTKSLSDKQTELISKEEEVKSLSLNCSDVSKQAQIKTLECDKVTETVSKLKKELKTKSQCFEVNSTRLSTLEEEFIEKTERLESLTTVLTNLQREHEKLNESFALANKQLTDRTRDLDSTAAKADALSDQLIASEDTVAQSKAEKDALMDTKMELTTELEATRSQLESLRRERDSLLKKSSELSKQLETLRQQVANTSLASNTSLLDTSSHSQSGNQQQEGQDDTRSEMMSTSTVSRIEEVNRMRDLEDSFEERYSKLKLYAIKLKKKLAEQTKHIEQLEKSKGKGGGDADATAAAYKEKMVAMNKNFASLQAEYDQAQDTVDLLQKKVKALTGDLDSTMTESMNNKQSAADARESLQSAQNEAAKHMEKLRLKETEASGLKVTLENEQKERRSLEEQLTALQQLQPQIKEVETERGVLESTVATLKLERTQLEQTLAKEQERADRSHASLTATRSQLNQVEAELVKSREEGGEARRRAEDLQRAYEENRQELANHLAKSERSEGQEKSRNLYLERQLQSTESKLQGKVDELKEKGAELEKLKTEFDNYKVRAQSVLKQAKDANQQDEKKKNQDELNAMEKVNEAFSEKVRLLGVEIKTVQLEKSSLQDEHDRLMARHSLLLQELAGKEKSWRSRLEVQDQRIHKLEADAQGNEETLSNKLEMIKQKHSSELELNRVSHSQELSRLKTQIDVAENEIIRLEFSLQKEQEENRKQEEVTTGGTTSANTTYDRLDIMQIEREAAEGQEVDAPTPTFTSPLPLEQLLAQSELSDGTDRDTIRSAASSRIGGGRGDGGHDRAGRQVSHLSSLLAESEAQNARLEKLTEVLKEEIRTYQRSEERHKHIENLEYMKNVIVNFLTLGGEERARLIPVLTTMLRLNKDEINKIQQVTKAEDESGVGGEGWGSYLHLWSNP